VFLTIFLFERLFFMDEIGDVNEKRGKLLTLLLESAIEKKSITYEDLARQSDFDQRGIGIQLGIVGEYLEKKKHSVILNSIAVSKNTGVPSGSFERFFYGYGNLNDEEKKILVLLLQKCVFEYNGWKDILDKLKKGGFNA
jgi:hypothetical protein